MLFFLIYAVLFSQSSLELRDRGWRWDRPKRREEVGPGVCVRLSLTQETFSIPM